ncbi:LuxR C-terminal-related transcriptional regulator [Microbacterium sp. STN6]|uniref:hybrid sensor histidine kinase/response regulator transcription factor n=1 Tax=Microbacterium sp. STN6 TaxID=2995588 RepID=UPI002260A048|nr:LuxR C-terminal-related transcriptional regulator [Microbacterium sp. STN6]MCX7522407.1 LuxR C-terminal-related transcriptional regulator [Microbacterium sp. STN6]
MVFDDYSQVRGGHIPEGEREQVHSVIGVPIRWNGSIIGSCVVFSRSVQRRFGPADTALLEMFATHAAIAMTNARLHALAAERSAEAAIMVERERSVRDVHDSVGRGLAALLLRLDRAEAEHEAGRDPREAICLARADARSALSETRRSVLGLGPAMLDGRSLTEAVALELAWVESTSAVKTRLTVLGEHQQVEPEAARQLFRIIQEALVNVVEHARASHLRVGLVSGNRGITTIIEDDGRGFDVAELRTRASDPATRPLGLQGLIARAEHLGGAVHIDSTVGWGTRLRVELPSVPAGLAPRELPRWKVLVAHESAVVRAGLVRMLDLAEPDVQVVGELGDSAQVVDAYQLLRPHVVLVHLGMPHIDGVRLTSFLRAADPAAAVVLLVDSPADDRVRHAAQGGAVGFVGSDTDAAGLARTVIAAARGESVMTSQLFSSMNALDLDVPSAAGLTARERQVRAQLEQGLPDKAIALILGISVKTVEKHVGSILRKTGAANRTALAVLASLHD